MKKYTFFVLVAAILVSFGCSEDVYVVSSAGKVATLPAVTPPPFTVTPTKWYGGKQSALTITYDASWGLHDKITAAADEVVARGLRIDFEVVTATYENYPEAVARMRNEAIPSGIHFFGHGHEHDLHDSLNYEECYTSFRHCYDLMYEWGLQPRAYAYPGSSAYELITQLANRQAGFICARGAEIDRDRIYICPDDTVAPENWQYLPSLVMGQDYPEYVHDHAELVPLVETNIEKSAWLILMYHSIGFEGSYAYYPLDEFIADLDYFAANDIWVGNLDMVASYVQERNRFYIDIDYLGETVDGTVGVKFCDGLDNDVFVQPLTVEIAAMSETLYQTLHIEPAINGAHDFPLVDNAVQLDVVPDEQPYRFTFVE